MYTPAFVEIFVGLIVVVLWSRWLRDRSALTAIVVGVPWAVGGTVLIGQLVAVMGLMQASAGAGDAAVQMVFWGRWGSGGAAILAVVVLAGLTVHALVSPRKA